MFEEFKRTIETARVLDTLDEQVVSSLFAPAARAGVFLSTGMPWQDPANKYRADVFIRQLLPLSEFYQEINPPLSAALWGIWNAVTYFRRQRSLSSIVSRSKKTNAQIFSGVRALVATAAVQFSDGTASTVETSDAMTNLSSYKKHVEKAIRNLSAVSPK